MGGHGTHCNFLQERIELKELVLWPLPCVDHLDLVIEVSSTISAALQFFGFVSVDPCCKDICVSGFLLHYSSLKLLPSCLVLLTWMENYW